MTCSLERCPTYNFNWEHSAINSAGHSYSKHLLQAVQSDTCFLAHQSHFRTLKGFLLQYQQRFAHNLWWTTKTTLEQKEAHLGPPRLLHQKKKSYPDSGFRHSPKHNTKTPSTTFHCWSPDRSTFSRSRTRHYDRNMNGVHKQSRGIYFVHFSWNIWVIPRRYLGDANTIPWRYPGRYLVTWAICEPVFAPVVVCGAESWEKSRTLVSAENVWVWQA